jgi:hypothetical protein
MILERKKNLGNLANLGLLWLKSPFGEIPNLAKRKFASKSKTGTAFIEKGFRV